MAAIGHVIAPGAEAIGAAAGAVLAGVPAEAVRTIAGGVSDVGLGVIDSFVIDNLKVGWTPRAYFDRLRRIQRAEASKRRAVLPR